MELTVAAADEIARRTCEDLGVPFDQGSLGSVEHVSAALRRAATFSCPCPKSTLRRLVSDSLHGLSTDSDRVDEVVRNTLDLLITYGDLFEVPPLRDEDASPSTRLVVYTAPPAVIERRSGALLLIGIGPEHNSALPDWLEGRVSALGALRQILEPDDETVRHLEDSGFLSLNQDRWLRAPRNQEPEELIAHYDQVLSTAAESGSISGLEILDPAKRITYYKGRWVSPETQTGRFVARRDQTYGAKLWCYAELHHGAPQRFVDLPLDGSYWNGWDEAWWLQAAIDSCAGQPQPFRLRPATTGTQALDLFSPVPSWIQRRWAVFGEEGERGQGCLMTYVFPESEIQEEANLLSDGLWMKQEAGPARELGSQ